MALALALGACGDDDDARPVTTTTPDPADTTITTAEPTSTTATTTFAQADTPPELVNTGEDFDAIVRSFVAYGSWLGAHPSLEGLEQVVRRGSPEWNRLQQVYERVISNGWRDDGSGPARVVEARVLERPSAGLVILYVVLENPAFRLIDSSGETVEEIPAEPTTAWAYELRLDGSERWLIENRTSLGEP